MEIIVKGEGTKSFKPNQIEISFDFKYKAKEYNEVVENGVKNVDNYLNMLEKLGFKKEDVKTRSFRVSEDKVYNETTRTYNKVGFVYSQNALLKFDYDMEKLSFIMEETSKLIEPPIYHFNFTVKDNKKAEEELIALAYKEAEFQANAIAKASGKKLTGCAKVGFEPFDGRMSSRSEFGCAKMAYSDEKGRSVSETIQTIFVPEDVEATMELYCIFIAE